MVAAKDILTRKRNYTYHAGGVQDEQKVLEFLFNKGHSVEDSEAIEDITLDIDCYLNGIPTSIKSQHSGLNYGNIYFELATQHYTGHKWDETETLAHWLQWLAPAISQPVPAFTPAWNPSWFLYGGAEQYLILQGDSLKLYLKNDLETWVKRYGFQRIRGLSWKVLQTQNGKNTACGYLETAKAPHIQEWKLT